MGIGESSSIRGIQRSLERTKRQLSRSHARLASGERVEAASDDPSGLSVSERRRSLLASLHASGRNVSDGIRLTQTAARGLDEVGDLLDRMRELAVQAAQGTLTDDDRARIEGEFGALRDEVDRVSSSVEFHGTKLLDGSTPHVAIQAGPGQADTVDVELEGVSASDLGIDGARLGDQASAAHAAGDLDAAIGSVARRRSELGLTSSELTSRARSLGRHEESTAASESRIRDADVAAETARRAQLEILARGQLALLTQANVSNAAAGALVD